MSAEGQTCDPTTDADAAEERSGRSARRESIFILLGFVAVALIVAFVRQEPLGSPTPWQGATTAAGESAPAVGAEMVRLLDAVRGNVGAWRLITLLLIGSIAGMLANRLVPGNRAGTTGAVFIGIFGSALAGLVCQHAGMAVPTCVSVTSVAVAFVGSIVTLLAAKCLALV